jgi:hypothetical protein
METLTVIPRYGEPDVTHVTRTIKPLEQTIEERNRKHEDYMHVFPIHKGEKVATEVSPMFFSRKPSPYDGLAIETSERVLCISVDTAIAALEELGYTCRKTKRTRQSSKQR